MKKLVAYLQQRRDNFTAILQLPPQDYVPETFHELRVEIKKLRAVISLAQAVAPAFQITQQQRYMLQTIFKSAGMIRERQLEAAFIKNAKHTISYNAFAWLRLHLLLAEETEKVRFFDLLNSNVPKIIGELCDELINYVSKLEKVVIYHFLQRQQVQIRQKMQAKHTHEQLHSIRKQLKTHEYALKSTGYQPPKWNSGSIAQLLDLLGTWQDCEAMIQSFQQQAKAVQAPCIKEALHLLIRQLAFRRQNIAQQLTL